MSGTRVTVGDVAKAAGVSVSTVSYAFSGSRPIGEGAKKRVFDAAAKLGYKPFLPAKRMGGGSTGAVGLVVSYFANQSTGLLLDAFAEKLKAAGLKPMVCGVGASESAAREALSYLSQGVVDGVVNLHSSVGVNEAKVLCGQVPCVTYLRPHPDSPAYIDYIGGYGALLEHLWSLGHRRIGLIDDPGARPPEAGEEMKRAAYRQFLSAKGRPFDEALVVEGDMRFESGYRLAGTLFDRGATAVFAPSDSAAIGVAAWAGESGLSLPRDLSIVSPDDSWLAAAANPPLTCMHLPRVELAELTVAGLLSLVAGGEAPPQRLLTPSVIVRKSTAAPRKA